MCKEQQKNVEKFSLSFCGCGFLCLYHAGVCAAIREFAPQLLKVPILGASAGSILGACIASDVSLSKAISLVLDVVAKARSFTFGALNRDFDLMRIVRKDLEIVLPENAHKLCTGRLYVSVTRFNDFSNQIISEFHSRQELIDAIVCSCFIPIYGGFDYPRYRGERYVDGGISINQPILDENTVTVSPFAGENDICPTDVDSANLLGLMFSGTSIRFTMSNLMRIFVCLFPPPPEACAKICQQGFEDALRYLFLNGFSPCGDCLTVQADSLDCESGASSDQVGAVILTPAINGKFGKQRTLPPVRRALVRKRKGSECRTCLQAIDPYVKPPFARLFPKLIKEAFDDALKAQNAYAGFFYSLRIVRLARTLLLPALICLQLFKFWKSFGFWFASYAFNDWLLASIKHAVKAILKEIMVERAIGTASLEEVKVQTSDVTSVNELPPSVGRAIFEAVDFVAHHEDQITKETSQKQLASVEDEIDKLWLFCNQDCYYKAIEYTEEHENVIAFYYLDDSLRAHFCHVHGVDHDAMLRAIGGGGSATA